MKKLKINLPAGVDVPVSIVGDYIFMLVSNSDVRLKIADLNIDTDFPETMGVKFERQFSNFILSSKQSQIVELAVARGKLDYASVSGILSIKQANVINNVTALSVGLTALKLIAANSGRKAVRIQNLGTSPVFIGGAAVTSANGIQLGVGETWFEDDAAESDIYAISTVVGQDVRVQWV